MHRRTIIAVTCGIMILLIMDRIVRGWFSYQPGVSDPGDFSLMELQLVVNSTSHDAYNAINISIIVITFNRPTSLHKLLTSLNTLATDGSPVHLSIWIDVDSKGKPHEPTLVVANSYHFPHGHKSVHVQPRNVGIYGQWVKTWRPEDNSSELALILEDDLSLSPFSIRWLKMVHSNYRQWDKVAGYSLQCHNVMTFANGRRALPNLTSRDVVFAYRVLGTWGFAPHPRQWRKFQDWIDTVKSNKTFKPYVEGIIPTLWYKKFEKQKREHTMWEMWHIYFTHVNKLVTIYPNLNPTKSHSQGRCLVVNRQEAGLHYSKGSVVNDKTVQQSLLNTWSLRYELVPRVAKTFDYNGSIVAL